MKSLSDAGEFHDPESTSSSGVSHVSQSTPYCSESQDHAEPRFWIAARCTAWYGYIKKRFFESQPAREGSSSALFESSRNLTSSSCGLGQGNTGKIMEHGRGVETRSVEFSKPTPRFARVQGPFCHTGGTYSRNGAMD